MERVPFPPHGSTIANTRKSDSDGYSAIKIEKSPFLHEQNDLEEMANRRPYTSTFITLLFKNQNIHIFTSDTIWPMLCDIPEYNKIKRVSNKSKLLFCLS